jgi:mannose-6-phosphate isomerase-like protein (cupin superfamily)
VDEAADWKVISLDDVEAIAWAGTELEWRPLRRALGTRIAGMAAFTAQRAGQEIVEAHRESTDGRDHEEVYVVLRGRALFTLDGVQREARAGTFVAVAAHVHRHAVALEAGTAVLALGGPPTFVPSASEWIERARPHVRARPERARAVVEELRAARPGSVGLDIAEALLAVGRGDEDSARASLAAAIAREPAIAATLAADRDLAPFLPR